ncbi:hypothetical protein M422DRAFT_77381, partial [Sphaerobolus stellatus SS14]
MRREPNLRAAHLIIFLTNPRTANRLVQDSIKAAQTLLWCRKLMKELSRRLKCHKIGSEHFANACPEANERCRTCSAGHRTKESPVVDRQGRYYINCKLRGHAAWDRGCPAFVDKYHRMVSKVPDNQYKYYPIVGDTTSW